MKQLHPRAVWLFFIPSLWLALFWLFIIFFLWLAFILPDNQVTFLDDRNSEAAGKIRMLTGFGVFHAGGIILILALLYIWSRLAYRYYRYEFTETALKKEHGVIWKKYVSIPYDRVQNVDIHRGLIARFLGLSDLQIQTAGGITAGSYGAFSEGYLPGLSREEAERLREDLIQRVQRAKSQGL